MVIKMFPRFFIIFIVSCGLVSCGLGVSKDRKVFINNIKSYAKKIPKEEHLLFMGTNAYMPDNLKSPPADMETMYVWIFLKSDKKLLLPESKKMTVEIIKEIIRGINTDENIQPYLNGKPFTWRNLEFAIFFESKDGIAKPPYFVEPPYIALAQILNSQLYFSYYDKDAMRLYDAHKEPCNDIFDNKDME